MGETEIINDNLDPRWVRSFDVQYYFEKRDYFKVVVYDIDDFDRQPGKSGNIKIHAEEKVGKHNEQLSFQLSA
jgi:hypothetical protein